MQFLRRSLTGIFILAVTLGCLTFAGRMVFDAVQAQLGDDGPRRPARERVFAVNVITVEPGQVQPVLRSFGEIRSAQTLDLRPRVGGKVTELHPNFRDGARVEAGQVLLRIDPADAKAARDIAQADLTASQTAVRDAARDVILAQDDLTAAQEQAALRDKALARQQKISESGFGAAAQVETAELAAASAHQAVVSRRQAVAAAETRQSQAATALALSEIAMAEAERRLADTTLIAEFDGTLTDVSLVQGGVVTPNEALGRLIGEGRIEVAFRVSVAQYSRLLDANGKLLTAPVQIQLDMFGTALTAEGRITRDSPAVGEGQTGRLIFAEMPAAPGFLPGDFVTVLTQEPLLRGAAIIPATALGANNTVLVVGEGNRLSEAEAQVMRRQGDDVIIRARELAGQQVVASRSPVLGAGIRVRPVTPAPEGEALAAAEPEMLELSDERRAALIAFVEGNQRMPDQVKTRLLAQLAEPMVPASMVSRLESRMGG
ncbi:hemolysin D [Actibacterium mucosum KCTC 23349]|uniref:Hemolysin D n=1 Tax=Actibacterium mucosum KCTC 23349 TaxID=1454373 RepID=A0A037ZJ36_9RHOB|nr:HlyD family efflux transporter periplasmic adaptor subunit [Actibacterium mucosum]KAJ56128.1 hemolysin D [Actibacterium mucosum KCTC 23349]